MVLPWTDWNVQLQLDEGGGSIFLGIVWKAQELLQKTPYICNREMSSKRVANIFGHLPLCEIVIQLRSLRSSWYRMLANIMGKI